MSKTLIRLLFAASALAPCLPAAITVTFTPSVASPQPVGATVTWTASATDTNAGSFDFQFSVSNNGQAFQIFQDYDVSNVYAWTPSFREGSFTVKVIARNMTTQQAAAATVPYTITTRVTVLGGPPLITPAVNPLVALYSAPGCPTGSYVRVKFTNGTTLQRTSASACSPTASTNIYVAGMLAATTYNMNYEVITGTQVTSGPVLPFTTGVVNPSLTFPAISIPLSTFTDTKQQVLLLNAQDFTAPNLYFPFATDLSGRVIWYYPQLAIPQQQTPYDMRPAAGGTILMLVNDPNHPSQAQQLFREIDLAGNSIRQTSVTRVSQQLVKQGKVGIISFNHDAIRLTNGHTILIAYQEEIFPAGTQGSMGPVDILGDAIIDLDQNMQVAWSWSAYDHLDITRPAVLGETCLAGHTYGCPPIHLAAVANDWLHCNSLNYVPADGSLIVSCRNQDWVYKVDYGNETGTSNVLWTLGLDGDFTMTGTTDPYPWFSHQHDVEFAPGSTTLLTVFDDGNTRVMEYPGENSRGQALTLNQTALTASLTLNANLNSYSVAVGSAQLLDNGNYHFDSGWVTIAPGQVIGQSLEVSPGASILYNLTDGTVTYRSYRMATLYSIP